MKIGSRTKPTHKIQLAKVGNIPDSRLEPGYNGWIRADLHQMLFRLAILLIAAFPIFSASIAMAADSGNSPSDSLDAFTMVMGLLGGLALFLFGMEQMSDALKALAADRLKEILAREDINLPSRLLRQEEEFCPIDEGVWPDDWDEAPKKADTEAA